MAINLEKEIRRLSLEFFGERWLVMGKPKVGKSFFAASFPDVYVINLDGPLNRYAYRDAVVRDDVRDWGDAQAALSRAKKSAGWRTLVLDTCDKLVVMMNQAICAAKSEASIGDIPHGAGWERQVARFSQFLEQFWSIAEEREDLAGTIVVAHSKKGDDGQSLVIRKALMSYLQGGVCNIVYAYKERRKDEEGKKKLNYMLDLSGSRGVEAGCRNETLQEAGEVESSFDSVCDLFSDEDNLKKALRWLQKGGIDKGKLTEFCHDFGISSGSLQYELIKAMRKSKTLFDAVKKQTEE